MRLICTMLSLMLPMFLFTQSIIDVTDQTIKIGGGKEEELYIGFAAGDKIVFTFKETNGKDLKEVEILEYPSTSKYSAYKIDRIDSKEINVNKHGVYIFRFKNSALGGRICSITIRRIPGSDASKDFNTSVKWITRQDTTWNTFTKDVVVGYDTVYLQKSKKELISSEQREELIMDKTQRVHSETNSNGNKTYILFSLPINTHNGYREQKVVAWAYWVGVGEEANAAWRENSKAIGTVVKNAARMFSTPLGALAIGSIVDLTTPKLGEDVAYAIADEANKSLFMSGLSYKVYDHGKGVAGFRSFSDPGLCQGKFYICLYNDNFMQGIDATIKISAIVETNVYEDKLFTELQVNPKTEKQLFKEPLIKSYREPITGY